MPAPGGCRSGYQSFSPGPQSTLVADRSNGSTAPQDFGVQRYLGVLTPFVVIIHCRRAHDDRTQFGHHASQVGQVNRVMAATRQCVEYHRQGRAGDVDTGSDVDNTAKCRMEHPGGCQVDGVGWRTLAAVELAANDATKVRCVPPFAIPIRHERAHLAPPATAGGTVFDQHPIPGSNGHPGVHQSPSRRLRDSAAARSAAVALV